MLNQLIAFLVSFFVNPSILGIGLAVVFGAVWLACFWPPLFRRPWLWAVLATSAIGTLLAIAFIQVPMQVLSQQILSRFWSQEILLRWLLLVGMPAIVVSGLAQEGSKLVPVVVCWWHRGKSIDPKMGLAIGAVAGAGFGVFEAQWVHSSIFASGWSWESVQTNGLVALAGFWERFFTVAFHTASTALAGYGLAKGWGWQSYLLVSFLHALLNYSVLFLQSGLLSLVQVEVFIAVGAMLVTGAALWLRWRKQAAVAEA
jgi:hypothetical protein